MAARLGLRGDFEEDGFARAAVAGFGGGFAREREHVAVAAGQRQCAAHRPACSATRATPLPGACRLPGPAPSVWRSAQAIRVDARRSNFSWSPSTEYAAAHAVAGVADADAALLEIELQRLVRVAKSASMRLPLASLASFKSPVVGGQSGRIGRSRLLAAAGAAARAAWRVRLAAAWRRRPVPTAACRIRQRFISFSSDGQANASNATNCRGSRR